MMYFLILITGLVIALPAHAAGVQQPMAKKKKKKKKSTLAHVVASKKIAAGKKKKKKKKAAQPHLQPNKPRRVRPQRAPAPAQPQITAAEFKERLTTLIQHHEAAIVQGVFNSRRVKKAMLTVFPALKNIATSSESNLISLHAQVQQALAQVSAAILSYRHDAARAWKKHWAREDIQQQWQQFLSQVLELMETDEGAAEVRFGGENQEIGIPARGAE